MNKVQGRTKICAILIIAFCLGLLIFLIKLSINQNNWTEEKYYAAIGSKPITNYDILISYSNEHNTHEYFSKNEKYYVRGNIVDRNGVMLASISENGIMYSDNPSIRVGTLHIVGDKYSNTSTGVLRSLCEHFTLLKTKKGEYASVKKGNTVVVTENAEVTALATKLLGNNQGVVGVYNYKTGEILCMASNPSFDPTNIPYDIETNPYYEGAYINRFFSSTFTPGSTFKTFTLQVTLDNIPDILNQTFTCEGKIMLGDQVVNCTDNHGTQTLYQAYTNSCNCAFAEIAMQLDRRLYMNAINKSIFTKSYAIDNFVKLEKGSFDFLNCEDYEYAWSAIGLYKDLVNPASLMMYMGAVANGGTTAIPTELYAVKNSNDKVIKKLHTSYTDRLINKKTAKTMKDMMISNALDPHYNASRFNVSIGAKTGTVDRADGGMNGWFSGFVNDDRYPYAFVVYVDNGGFGRTKAADIAAGVVNALIKE